MLNLDGTTHLKQPLDAEIARIENSGILLCANAI
jgi:hypothetical protein